MICHPDLFLYKMVLSKKGRLKKMPSKNQMYFAKKPDTKHDRHLVDYRINDFDLKFNTDAGVFSKMRVDYGTGVLLKILPQLSLPAGNILDVGTGYGPLGLFAAKFWPNKEVELTDVNERALDLAKENANLNHLQNVKIYASDGYSALNNEKKFSLILSNPPIRAGKKVVNRILTGAKTHLVKDGLLMIVIQKKQGEPSARKLLEQVYGNCEIVKRDKGYYILKTINK